MRVIRPNPVDQIFVQGHPIEPRWSHHRDALTKPDRQIPIHQASSHVGYTIRELNPLSRTDRRQRIKQRLGTRTIRRNTVDGLNLDECEISLTFFRRPYLPAHKVTRAKVEPPNLRRRDVYIVWTWQIVALLRPQKAETVRQNFKYPLSIRRPHGCAFVPDYLEDKFLFGQIGSIVDTNFVCGLDEFTDRKRT
jgi:hypothetical protein